MLTPWNITAAARWRTTPTAPAPPSGALAQRVADLFHMKYVSPQESGTRSGLRWWRLTDDSGLGVEICSDRHFSASAIPFAIPQLDNGSPEYVRHPGDLVPDGRTHVNIESVQSGLGLRQQRGGPASPDPEYLLALRRLLVQLLLRPSPETIRRRTTNDKRHEPKRNVRYVTLRYVT